MRNNPIETLPIWAQLIYADWLRQEMANDSAMFQCATLEDTHKAFEMMQRAYVAGFRDRTKQLRPLPKVRENTKPDATIMRNGKGPPPLPQGPYNKGR